MIEWSESQLMIRDAVRRFVESEIAPHVEELEHGDLPPYDILRKMYAAFGMDEMARARFQKQIKGEKSGASAKASGKKGAAPTEGASEARRPGGCEPDSDHRALPLLPRNGNSVRRERWADGLRDSLEGND